MISSDFRAEARRKLTGKWGKAACIILAYLLIFFVLGFIEGFIEGLWGLSKNNLLISIINFIVEIPLTFGIIFALFKVYNSEEVKSFDFISLGFGNFKKSILVSLNMLLKMIVPFILMVVAIVLAIAASTSTLISVSTHSSSGILASSGTLLVSIILYIVSFIWLIVKSYSYKLSYIIAIDEPDLTAKEAVNKSATLMKGNRGKLFLLELSFIGWAILAIFTLGIGILWLMPYIQFATFAFYYFVAKRDNKQEPEVIVE